MQTRGVPAFRLQPEYVARITYIGVPKRTFLGKYANPVTLFRSVSERRGDVRGCATAASFPRQRLQAGQPLVVRGVSGVRAVAQPLPAPPTSQPGRLARWAGSTTPQRQAASKR